MTNETKFYYKTAVTLANSNGASTSNNQLSSACSTLYSTTDTGSYPDALFVLTTAGFSAAPTINTTVDVYIRPMNVSGTSDTAAPTAGASSGNPAKYVCSFVLRASSTSGELYYAVGYDIPAEGEAYLMNNGTGVTLSANWKLEMVPRTYGPV